MTLKDKSEFSFADGAAVAFMIADVPKSSPDQTIVETTDKEQSEPKQRAV